MAKKTPKNQTSTEETTNNAVQQEVQKAAVNVDSKNESSKAKKSANTKRRPTNPTSSREWAKASKVSFPSLKRLLGPREKKSERILPSY